MLMVDVDPADSYESIINVYSVSSMMTPTIPFITGNQGVTFTQLLSGYSGGNNYNCGGILDVISPNRSFVETDISEASADVAIQSALDSRPAISIKSTAISNQSQLGIFSVAGARIDFTVPQNGKYDLSIIGANGRLVGVHQMTCLAGRNSVSLGKIAQGAYIVRIAGSSGVISRICTLRN